MKNLLAIGNAAANVVKQLSQYPVYNCYYITNEIKKTSKYRLKIPTLPGPEEYELMDMTKLHSWIEKIPGGRPAPTGIPPAGGSAPGPPGLGKVQLS